MLADLGGGAGDFGTNLGENAANLGANSGKNYANLTSQNALNSNLRDLCAQNGAKFIIDPRDFGFANIDENELLGGSGADNAALALDILRGKRQNRAVTAAVSLNAGALLWLCGRAPTLKAGVKAAQNALTSGAVLAKIDEILAAQKDISREFS